MGNIMNTRLRSRLEHIHHVWPNTNKHVGVRMAKGPRDPTPTTHENRNPRFHLLSQPSIDLDNSANKIN